MWLPLPLETNRYMLLKTNANLLSNNFRAMFLLLDHHCPPTLQREAWIFWKGPSRKRQRGILLPLLRLLRYRLPRCAMALPY